MTPANGELLRRGDDPDSTHGGHAFLEDLKRHCYNADTKELTFEAELHDV